MKKIISMLFFLTLLLLPLKASSIDISPLTESYYNNGVYLYKNGDKQKALENFKKAIQSEPSYGDSYYNVGVILEEQKKIDQAIYYFKKAYELKPNDYDALYRLGVNYFNKNEHSMALEYLVQIPIHSSAYKSAKSILNQIGTVEICPSLIKPCSSVIANKTSDYEKFGLVNKFSAPTGITKDSKGNIYIASFTDNIIFKITLDGTTSVYSKNKKINGPIGIACDKKDNLYVANYSGNNILKISKHGIVTEYLKNIVKPYYLFIDDSALYVSEQNTNTVFKHKLSE